MASHMDVDVSGARAMAVVQYRMAKQIAVPGAQERRNILGGVKQWVGAAARVLVPSTCLSCDEVTASDGAVCPACWQKFHFLSPPVCDVTGAPFSYALGQGALSAEAIANPPDFDRARSALLYTPPARRLVSRLKYSDDTALARWMAQWMQRAVQEVLEAEGELCSQAPLTVMPVPLHRKRLAQRRYNQSAELARALVRGSERDLLFDPETLVRHRATPAQVGLGQTARQRNVAGAFRVPEERRIAVAGRPVLLVDDVLTTGATVNACSRTLKRAGASRVLVVTFARVPHGGFDAAL